MMLRHLMRRCSKMKAKKNEKKEIVTMKGKLRKKKKIKYSYEQVYYNIDLSHIFNYCLAPSSFSLSNAYIAKYLK